MSIANQVDATAAAALDLMLRKRAARQAAGQLNAPVVIEKVRVLVTKLGADKISMGIHIAGIGDAYYEQGEEFDAERPLAEALEDKGMVMILGAGTGAISTVEAAMQQASITALAEQEALAAQRAAAASAAIDAARLELQPKADPQPDPPPAPVIEPAAAPVAEAPAKPSTDKAKA